MSSSSSERTPPLIFKDSDSESESKLILKDFVAVGRTLTAFAIGLSLKVGFVNSALLIEFFSGENDDDEDVDEDDNDGFWDFWDVPVGNE